MRERLADAPTFRRRLEVVLVLRNLLRNLDRVSPDRAKRRREFLAAVVRHASSLVPADGLFREVDVDLLHVEILLDAPLAELAADAALLVAAPRRLDVGRLHV